MVCDVVASWRWARACDGLPPAAAACRASAACLRFNPTTTQAGPTNTHTHIHTHTRRSPSTTAAVSASASRCSTTSSASAWAPWGTRCVWGGGGGELGWPGEQEAAARGRAVTMAAHNGGRRWQRWQQLVSRGGRLPLPQRINTDSPAGQQSGCDLCVNRLLCCRARCTPAAPTASLPVPWCTAHLRPGPPTQTGPSPCPVRPLMPTLAAAATPASAAHARAAACRHLPAR